MIAISKGTLREIEFVVSHLREADYREISCQFYDDEFDNLALFAYGFRSNVCRINDEAVAVFSFTPINCATVAVNLFGTDRIERAIPAITRFIFTEMIPQALDVGINRFEARSLISHAQAHQWLEQCGAVREGRLCQMGKNGEDFYLFALTRSRLEQLKLKRWQR